MKQCETKLHYAKLSTIDLGFIRSPGPGLGNLLFPIARALTAAKTSKGTFVEPTIPQIKIGTFLRQEIDKRTYFGLFAQRTLKQNQIWICYQLQRIMEVLYIRPEKSCISHYGLADQFHDLPDDPTHIKDWIYSRGIDLDNNKEKFIAVHVRQGDFGLNTDIKQNTRLQLSWYRSALNHVTENANLKNLPAIIFTDEDPTKIIKELNLPNLEAAPKLNALQSLMLMSKAECLIGSCSTFSLWSSYLSGQHSVWHKEFNVGAYKRVTPKDEFI